MRFLFSAKDAFHTEGYPYPYTGPLRAIYPVIPVPKRTLPEIIVRPDYALNSSFQSFPSSLPSPLFHTTFITPVRGYLMSWLDSYD